MTAGELQKQLEVSNTQTRKDALKLLNDTLNEDEDFIKYGASIKVDFDSPKPDEDRDYKLTYLLVTLKDFTYNGTTFWKYGETLDEVARSIKKYVLYVLELAHKFPEYTALNDYIQQHRIFEKQLFKDDLASGGSNLRIVLTDYFKLHNITNYSVGGGDYEIKRTPQRIAKFEERIQLSIDELLDCIVELKKMQSRLNKLKETLDYPSKTHTEQ